jgi:hypothetical protein
MAVCAAILAFIATWVATLCTWDYIMDGTSRKMQTVTLQRQREHRNMYA